MANRWGIPKSLELQVIHRDRRCVYCQVEFGVPDAPRRSRPSWEHVINDVQIVTPGNIALCCIGCNASKGAKTLSDWLSSKYCLEKGITEQTVSKVIQEAIRSANAEPARFAPDGRPAP